MNNLLTRINMLFIIRNNIDSILTQIKSKEDHDIKNQTNLVSLIKAEEERELEARDKAIKEVGEIPDQIQFFKGKIRDDYVKALPENSHMLFIYLWYLIGDMNTIKRFDEFRNMSNPKIENAISIMPTEAQYFAIRSLDNKSSIDEINALAKKYIEAKVQLQQKLQSNEMPTDNAINEWIRQYNLKNPNPSWKQVTEGLHQREWITNPITGIRSIRVSSSPSINQINMGLQLKEKMYNEPNKHQINIGVYYTEQGKSIDEVKILIDNMEKKLKEFEDSMTKQSNRDLLLDLAIPLLDEFPDLTVDKLVKINDKIIGNNTKDIKYILERSREFVNLSRQTDKNLTDDYITEAIRQHHARNRYATIKQIEEVIDYMDTHYYANWKKKEATMDEIDESIRLKDIEKINPTKDQVVESMRLKRIGIDNPTLLQITLGLELEKKNNVEEIKKLEAKYNATSDYLKELLKTDQGLYKPSEYDIILGIKLEKLLNHKPNKNEFDIATKYYNENRKEFIDAAVHLKELGIVETYDNHTLNLIKSMEELMKQKRESKPTAYDLEEKLLFDIFGKKIDHDSPERKEIERQIYLSKESKFKFLVFNPKTISKSINIGLTLGPHSTYKDITNALEMKEELTLDNIRKYLVFNYLDKPHELKTFDKLTSDQVDAWFYLRDNLKKQMEKSNPNDILKYYIPAIVQWRLQKLTPTLEDIDKYADANKKFNTNLTIDQFNAWKYLQKFQEDIDKLKLSNAIILKVYILIVMQWRMQLINPTWEQIRDHASVDEEFNKLLTFGQYKAWMILRNLKEIKTLNKNIILKDYMPVAEKYMKEIKLFENQKIVYNSIFDWYIDKFPENSDDRVTIINIQKKLNRKTLEQKYKSGQDPFSPLLTELNTFIDTKKSEIPKLRNPFELYDNIVNQPSWKNIQYIVGKKTTKK